MIRSVMMAALIAAGMAAPAAAEETKPRTVRQLYDCRTIADAAQRLACFDSAVAAMAAAEQDRSLQFAEEDAFKRITADEMTGTIASATTNSAGRWIIVLTDGSRWLQSDDKSFAAPPAEGNTFAIRRGPLGAYQATIRGRTIRVRQIG